jgi:capsular exopolysaccharide synthesis family protein
MVLNGDRPLRTFAVVSPNADAGKSFISLHLSEAIATFGSNVVLIDADLRRPVIHEWLGIDRASGLTDFLGKSRSLQGLRMFEAQEGLHVLPSGGPVADPTAVLGGRAFARLMEAFDQNETTAIVDTPPVGVVADAVPVAVQCDATIFVVDVTTSRRRAIRAAIDTLHRSGANLVGVVANRTAPRRADYYGY